MIRRGALWVGLIVLLASLGCTTNGSTETGRSAPVATGPYASAPCRSSNSTPITHVVWILMENKASDRVVGNSDAPYLNGLARRCGLADNDHGVAHPSLPIYIALTSGGTQGITDDHGPAAHPLSVSSIFSQLSTGGRRWKSYEEAMPGNCTRSDSGRYAVRHNPATYYTDLASACATADVPYGQLATDLQANDLPAFSFVTPDLCHDMHNCGVTAGDTWLSQELPALLESPAYRSGSTAVFVTWDEDDHSSGNRIPLFVVAPAVRPGTVTSVSFQHQALLDLTEQLLRLPALPGAAGGTELRRAFGL
jgi:phospholipase C